MFEVRRVEDRDPKTGRLNAIGVMFHAGGLPILTGDPLPQTDALNFAVEITKAAGGSIGMFETAWKRAEEKEVARQRAASVPR